MRLYSDLVEWYPLVDPAADHAPDAEIYRNYFLRAAPAAATLLELGSGAGHNAVHMKAHYRCTLTDLSPAMLSLSRTLNPECEHLEGDMRSLSLGRTFDVVLVHDAVCYITTPDDLRAVARTAYAHTAPGGAAIFEPDCVRETFRESADVEGNDAGDRGVRFLMWTRDPDPTDDTYLVDFAFLLRDGAHVQAVHDQHVEGLFSRAFWIEALSSAGYAVDAIRARGPEVAAPDLFLCRRAR